MPSIPPSWVTCGPGDGLQMITAGPDSIWESQKGLNLDGMNVPSEVMVLPFLNLLACC